MDGVMSAGRTALLVNQNPDLILAILNMLAMRSPISSYSTDLITMYKLSFCTVISI